MSIETDITTDARTFAADPMFMQDFCHNTETGETHPCAVFSPRSFTRIERTPRFLRIPEWPIEQPYGVAVDVGHHLTVTGTGAGAYIALTVENQATERIVSRVLCALMTANTDGWNLPVKANATASFIDPERPQFGELTAQVYLFHPTVEDLQMYGLDVGTRWGVLFDPAMHWPNSTVTPDDGDEIRCALALGTNDAGRANKATLSAVIREYGVLPVATAFFTEDAH